jgi:hypothetical protein
MCGTQLFAPDDCAGRACLAGTNAIAIIFMNPLGSIPFADGVTRTVYLDADGGQFVLNEDGTRIRGEWLYVDEPEVITRDTAES